MGKGNLWLQCCKGQKEGTGNTLLYKYAPALPVKQYRVFERGLFLLILTWGCFFILEREGEREIEREPGCEGEASPGRLLPVPRPTGTGMLQMERGPGSWWPQTHNWTDHTKVSTANKKKLPVSSLINILRNRRKPEPGTPTRANTNCQNVQENKWQTWWSGSTQRETNSWNGPYLLPSEVVREKDRKNPIQWKRKAVICLFTV